VLKFVSRFIRRPAAASLRRPSFIVYMSCLVCGLLANGCAVRQPTDPDGVRQALRRALRMVRPEMPERARQLERLYTEAVVATAAESATPWWEGSVGRSESAWLRALLVASRAAREFRAQRAVVELHAAGLMQQARDDVSRARAEIRETGMARQEAAAMEKATTNLGTAQRLIAADRYKAAAEELKKARENSAVVHRGWTSLHARFGDPTLRRQWQGWADQTIDASRRTGGAALLIDKLRRRVFLYRDGRLVASWAAELGANGLRRKEKSGDRATPEGMYRVTEVKQNSHTRFYKALLINYPNDEDRMRFALAQRRGQLSALARIGNLIEIHGEGGEGRDWTDGCVALTNADIDKLFPYTYVGMPVTIVGTYDR
jgi:hypothetical protein